MKTDKNILVLTYWSFDDALIQTYTLPYLKIIADIIPKSSKLFLFTLEKKNVKTKNITTKIKNISARYYPFGLRAILAWLFNFIRLFLFIKKNKITYIHCWCTPAGAVGYILSVLTGAKLIIDSYEPHAEAMVENGEWSKHKLAYKILFMLEKKQSGRAAFIVAATSGMKNYALTKYGIKLMNYHVKPACVDLEKFSIKNKKNPELVKGYGFEDRVVCVYAGKFGGIYLKDEVFEFYRAAYEYWKDDFRILVLTNQDKSELLDLVKKYDVPESIFKIEFVKHAEIADYIGLGDFAICPVKPVPTKRYCTPIKNGEYWAMGLPVVITNDISDDSGLIEENGIGAVIHEFNNTSYLSVIKEIDRLLKENKMSELYSKIRPFAEKYRNFNIAKDVYQKIYKID